MIRMVILNNMIDAVKKYMLENHQQIGFNCFPIQDTNLTYMVIEYSYTLNNRERIIAGLNKVLGNSTRLTDF